ncbi:MAG: 3-methyl-2-oxobutanoate hydroxymethyltransferase, partial [Actinomycetota bacterium]|nr:3-methyl-2-oxobutanoate hydroxymethyltransferase [Actinomycetota bacterium]
MGLSAPAIAARKVRDGGEPLVMVTAYDAPGARIASEARADLILVGAPRAQVVVGVAHNIQVA